MFNKVALKRGSAKPRMMKNTSEENNAGRWYNANQSVYRFKDLECISTVRLLRVFLDFMTKSSYTISIRLKVLV